MAMHLKALGFILALCMCACGEDEADAPAGNDYRFEDGFETAGNAINELFPANGTRWSAIQQANPANATNAISLTSQYFTEGQTGLHILAQPSDSKLSKMDIEKNGFKAASGDKVTIAAKFYIKGNQSLDNLLLIDLECCSCWDPHSGAENQCPGVRLKLSGEYLSIERGKISASTIRQTQVALPRNEWVHVQWEMTLSDTDTGENRLLIDGILVIDQAAMNMPNARIFKEAYADAGIAFELQEPVFYERVQVGVTANPTTNQAELFVDDFSIAIESIK
jgi:hypothetical protein